MWWVGGSNRRLYKLSRYLRLFYFSPASVLWDIDKLFVMFRFRAFQCVIVQRSHFYQRFKAGTGVVSYKVKYGY